MIENHFLFHQNIQMIYNHLIRLLKNLFYQLFLYMIVHSMRMIKNNFQQMLNEYNVYFSKNPNISNQKCFCFTMWQTFFLGVQTILISHNIGVSLAPFIAVVVASIRYDDCWALLLSGWDIAITSRTDKKERKRERKKIHLILISSILTCVIFSFSCFF